MKHLNQKCVSCLSHASSPGVILKPLVFMSLYHLYFLLSYMDTEQYEEAVRDYEKVYQTEKTKGKEV